MGRYQFDQIDEQEWQKLLNGVLVVAPLSTQVAYRIDDWISVGGGITTTFSALDIDLEGILPSSQISVDGDDTQVSFNLSWLFEASKKTRFGLTYQSETEFEYSGDVERNPGSLTAPVDLTLTLVYTEIGFSAPWLRPLAALWPCPASVLISTRNYLDWYNPHCNKKRPLKSRS